MNRQRSRGRLDWWEAPREAAAEHRADDEHDAEHDRLVLAGGAADERHVGKPDAEHEQRAELGQARELLDRGLADALVVALVEAEDLGRRDDGREQQQRPAAHVVGREEPDRDAERDRECDHVGERQRAAQASLAEVAFDVEALGDRRPRGRCGLDKRWPGEGCSPVDRCLCDGDRSGARSWALGWSISVLPWKAPGMTLLFHRASDVTHGAPQANTRVPANRSK